MMPKGNDKILCRTPSPGKQSIRIDQWKYDLMRAAILKVIPKTKEGILFSRLASLVKKQLSPTEQKRLGSLSWYSTVVKLDMEVRGEIERIEGATPQRLRRS